MRKAQERMRQARPYSDKVRNIAANLSQANPEYVSPFMRATGEAKAVGFIVVSTDKGLCGGLNPNVLRAVTNKMREAKDAKEEMYFKGDADKRKAIRQLFRKLDPTQEWAENNYYHLLIAQQNADLIPMSSFWKDYAAAADKSGFLASNLAEASHNFTEMMFALSVLDVPFTAEKPEVRFDGAGMKLVTGFQAEGGFGKVLAELGVPGLVLMAWLAVAAVRCLLSAISATHAGDSSTNTNEIPRPR
jgi:hypothetical protein